MSEREWRFYIDDMIRFAGNVLLYTKGMNQDAFVSTPLNYDATLRNLELIGEAATHIPDRIREASPGIRITGSDHGILPEGCCEKRGLTGQSQRTIKRFFPGIGHRKRLLNLVCFSGQFNAETGIEPASVVPTKSTPIHTHSGVRQPGMRGIPSFIAAYYAANNLRMRRMEPIISA
jgi:hypothetical protein